MVKLAPMLLKRSGTGGANERYIQAHHPIRNKPASRIMQDYNIRDAEARGDSCYEDARRGQVARVAGALREVGRELWEECGGMSAEIDRLYGLTIAELRKAPCRCVDCGACNGRGDDSLRHAQLPGVGS